VLFIGNTSPPPIVIGVTKVGALVLATELRVDVLVVVPLVSAKARGVNRIQSNRYFIEPRWGAEAPQFNYLITYLIYLDVANQEPLVSTLA